MVTDPYGNEFTSETAGSGRLNVTKAFLAKLAIEPTYLVFNLSEESPSETKYLHFHNLEEIQNDFKVSFKETQNVFYNYKVENGKFAITASLTGDDVGKFEDRALIEHDGIEYNIPIVVYTSEGSLDVQAENGNLSVQVLHPDWSYAKVSIINRDSGKTDTTSATPEKNAIFKVAEPGSYWVEAIVSTAGNSTDLFDFVNVMSVSPTEAGFIEQINIPGKSFVIVFVAVGIIALIGLKVRK